MTELSPAAQAVDTALAACIQLQGEIIRARPLAAAALEAVADQVVPEEPMCSLNARWMYERDPRQSIRSEFLAIAAELRGITPTEPSS